MIKSDLEKLLQYATKKGVNHRETINQYTRFFTINPGRSFERTIKYIDSEAGDWTEDCIGL